MEDRVISGDDLPDATVDTGKSKEYAPIDPDETYQVEVLKCEVKEVPEKFLREDEVGPKYSLSFTYAIIDEGGFYGRRIWDNTSLSLKPTTKNGKGEATKLYKIISTVMGVKFDWDQCASFAPNLKVLYKNIEKEVVGKQMRVDIENVEDPTGKIKTKVKTYKSAKKMLPPFDEEKSKAIRMVIEAEMENRKAKQEDISPDEIPF